MKVNNLEVENLGEISESIAEADSEKNSFYETEDDDCQIVYHKSISQPDIIYAFCCDEKGWCVMVEKLKIIN